MAVVFEKLGEMAIEAIAEEVVGKIIEEIKDLITNKADNPIRAEFTQSHLAMAARLVNEPVNVLIIFEHDHHDAKDLFAKGWKMGKLKCPCPHAGNTLLYECFIGKKAAEFHLKGDGGYINWAISGKFNRHGKDVSFEDV